MSGLGLARAALIAVALSQSLNATAAPPTPPRDWVDAAVAEAPATEAAREAVGEAEAAARMLRAGPHDWTLRGTGQQREVNTEGRFTEWETAVERGLRSPRKRSIDQSLAQLERERGATRLALAERDVRRAALEAWFAWLRAESRLYTLQSAVTATRELKETVARRHARGDAAAVEQTLGEAELAGLEGEAAAADQLARATRATLADYGPVPPLPSFDFDEPPARAVVATREDPLLALWQLDAERAQQDAARARADRLPDPVLGLRFANERGGAERIVGLTFSLPLPGARRSADADRAQARARALGGELRSARQRHAIQLREWQATADAAVARRRFLRDEAEARERVAAVLTRGYALGEGDLASVYLARRSAVQARGAAQAALLDAWQGVAVLALYGEVNESVAARLDTRN